MSSTERIFMRDKNSASGIFGVTTSASGSSFFTSVCLARFVIRARPPLAIITGSTTTFLSRYCSIFFATASTACGVMSMPVLTASAPISPSTESSCAAIHFGGTGKTDCTPREFCAVTAATANTA